jgi:hemerythrin-like domain-containing protein
MNATRILAAQHRAIEALFEEVESETRRNARARLVSRIAEELIAHMAGEEAVFYPALHRVVKGDDASKIEGAREEHVDLRVQLRRLLATRASDGSFLERVRELRSLFARHVADEEAGLFPCLERALSPSEHAVLGEEVLASRPPIWIVTSERGAYAHADDPLLRSRVSLPVPPAND